MFVPRKFLEVGKSDFSSPRIEPKAIYDYLLNFKKVTPKLTGKQMHASNLCTNLFVIRSVRYFDKGKDSDLREMSLDIW